MKGSLLFLVLTAIAGSSGYIRGPCHRDEAIHVVGMAGHGKSAIVRALVDQCDSPSGATETIETVKSCFGAEYARYVHDYPGFGTPAFLTPSWIKKFAPRYNLQSEKKVVILVVGARIYEQHVDFLQSLRNSDSLVVVRSQADIFPIDHDTFQAYWARNLHHAPAKIFVTSTSDPESFEPLKRYLKDKGDNVDDKWCFQ